PKRRRRWGQFSLRTLMIVLMIAAIPCAWVGRRISRHQRQVRAADAVAELGGHAYFSDVCYEDGTPHMSPQENESPSWLTSLLRSAGFDRTYNVVHVDFRSGPNKSRITDGDLAILADFPELMYVDLSDTNITDAALRSVASLKNLQTLVLRRTQ